MNKVLWRRILLISRIISVILGILILGLSVHSHFKSDWAKNIPNPLNNGKEEPSAKVICAQVRKEEAEEKEKAEAEVETKRYRDCGCKSCPNIVLEYIFVAVSISSLLLLLPIFIFSFRALPFSDSKVVKWIDVLYHMIFGLLFLMVGILYPISTALIDDLDEEIEKFYPEPDTWNNLSWEKYTAGGLAFVQIVLYFVIASIYDTLEKILPRRGGGHGGMHIHIPVGGGGGC